MMDITQLMGGTSVYTVFLYIYLDFLFLQFVGYWHLFFSMPSVTWENQYYCFICMPSMELEPEVA